MTINAVDVRTLSSSPDSGGVPLPPTEIDRIAAVLNRNTSHAPASEPTGTPSRRHPTPAAP